MTDEREAVRDGDHEGLGEEALRDLFSGLARPSLSPSFHRELRLRLAREKALHRTTRRWAAALRLYWLLAVAATLVVLIRLPLPDLWPRLSGPSHLVLLCGCLLPAVILVFVTRTDPVELALTSVEWLTRAAGRRPSSPRARNSG